MDSRLGASVDPAYETRITVIAAGIVLTFLIFFLRLVQLQIVEGEILQRRSEKNSIHRVRVEAQRGDIFDRENRLIATTRPAFGVQIIPSELKRREVTLSVLAELLGKDAAELDAKVGKPSGRRRHQPVRIADDLTFEQLARVETHNYALPGVFTDVRPRRHYVYGDLAAHSFGTLGEIRADQLEKRSFAGYQSGEIIGQTGLEAVLERHLRGRAGGRVVVVDVAGREVELLDEIEPTPGGSVRLTLDLDLQRAAEEAFLPDEEGAPTKMGALVALDPRTGDVLALVSRPAYDPNAFAGGVDVATWTTLNTDEWRPLHNRAISGQYPPGSTYKAIVAAAALQEGIMKPADEVYCPGFFRLGRRVYRCWKRVGHGDVAVFDALKASCDVYFYTAGLELGIDRIAHYAKRFGLGEKTGIEIRPERSGLIPTTVWKERVKKEKWIKGETVSASIGQGFNLTTPLQMAVAYAAIANGGEVLTPHLILQRDERDDGAAERREREVIGRVPVSQEVLAEVRQGLLAVVQEDGGTARRARVPGVLVAGKTGTSQVVHLKHTEDLEEDEIPIKYRDHAWFAAFAPVEQAEIVVVALAEHGGHGGSAAAPIAQRVLARYFEKKNLPPTEPSIEAELAPVLPGELEEPAAHGEPREEGLDP